MTRAVRVCHVITRLDLGGAQENTLYTVGHLRPPYAPTLVAGPGGLLDGEARQLQGVGVAFEPALLRSIHPFRDPLAILRLARRFRAARPDIVHTHSSKAGILGRLAARLAGVPVVVHTIHGFGFNTGQPALLRSALVTAERLVAPFTTHFIAVSRANLEEGVRRGIVDPAGASVIRSGVPLAAFRAAAADPALRNGRGLRHELGFPTTTPLVGMIACLKPQKAPIDFVETAARVAARHPEVRFVLVGDGELRGAVERRAAALGLRDRLRLLGWRRDMPRIMAALDVLVLTSLWEGLPRVLPEAFATGVPVVATGVDGTTDVLRDGDTGVVCRPHDVDALSAGVSRLLEDPAHARACAGRARACLPEFDIDAMVRAQEDLYARLLARPTGPPDVR
ncbi:MAG: glycosyltransferase [Candidatus Polarisedimenticolia bacterium]